MDEEFSGQHVYGTRAGIKISNRHPEILRISKKSLMSSSRLEQKNRLMQKISNAVMSFLMFLEIDAYFDRNFEAGTALQINSGYGTIKTDSYIH
jgi:hypothetical protein